MHVPAAGGAARASLVIAHVPEPTLHDTLACWVAALQHGQKVRLLSPQPKP